MAVSWAGPREVVRAWLAVLRFHAWAVAHAREAHADLPSGTLFDGFPKRVDLAGSYRAAFDARWAALKQQLLEECATTQSFKAGKALASA